MARKRCTAEEIIQKLSEAEVLLSQGQTVQRAARPLKISEQIYYRWRKACLRFCTANGNKPFQSGPNI